MHTICRIPSGSPVQYVVCDWNWFPLTPADYYGCPDADRPERTFLRRCDGGGALTHYEVQTEDIARYAVELIEKPDPPPIGIRAKDLPVMQEALRIAAVANPHGGTPEDDLAWILKRFVAAYSQEVPI